MEDVTGGRKGLRGEVAVLSQATRRFTARATAVICSERRLVVDERGDARSIERLVAHAAVVVSGETAGRGAEARRAGDEAERIDGEGGDRRGEPVRSWRETACSYRKRVRSSRETLRSCREALRSCREALRSCREAVRSLSEDRGGWHQEDETAGQAVTNASTTALVTGSGHG